MKKAMVVGYGSIGARHARLLEKMGCRPAVVSRRVLDFKPCYRRIEDALQKEAPDYAVIANETSGHRSALAALARAGFRGTVLVEKPLFEAPAPVPKHRFRGLYVGYNLRFHPILLKMKELLAGQKALYAQAYVGKYLPDWRPGSDYRTGYSADAKKGGGAMRDLSHELDYLNWLFGPWISMTALGGHFSKLAIRSDDCFAVLFEMRRCPVVYVQMNYLDHVLRREFLVHTNQHTLYANLVRGVLEIDGKKVMDAPIERDQTYGAEHRAAIEGHTKILCSLRQGLEVLRMIRMAETASRRQCWVKR